jgi:hypothetical protein
MELTANSYAEPIFQLQRSVLSGGEGVNHSKVVVGMTILSRHLKVVMMPWADVIPTEVRGIPCIY